MSRYFLIGCSLMPFSHLTVPSATALITAAFTGVWVILGFVFFLITMLFSSILNTIAQKGL